MFDYDGHDDFSQAVKFARENGFKVAFSNMCIEYWFDLHFFKHDGEPISMKGSSHSKAQIDILNSYIKKYNKTASIKIKLYDEENKRVEPDLFDLMLSINPETKNRRIVDAFIQAKSLHLQNKRNGCEFRESVTTMYELLQELEVVTIDNGNYSVRIK